MLHARRFWAAISLIGCALAAPQLVHGDDPPKIQTVSISPQSLTVVPGKPFSVRALVRKPAVIPGVGTWSLESKRSRGYIVGIAHSPDNSQFCTGGIDGTVRVHDARTGELVRAMLGHDSYVHSLSWSPDGNTIASAGTWDGTIRLWNAKNGMPLRVLKGHKTPVMHVAWSPDGSQLAAAGSHSGWIYLWNARMDSGDIQLEVGVDVLSLSWSPSGQHLSVTTAPNPVAIIDLSTRKVVKSLGEPGAPQYCSEWSPDGTRLAVGSVRETNIWDVDNETVETALPATAYSAAWSPDGKQLATAPSGGNIQIWDIATKKAVKVLAGPAATVLSWPKDDLIFAGGRLTVSHWTPSTGKAINNYSLASMPPPVWTNGRPIVSGLGTAKITLWDATTAKQLKAFEGHTAAVASVSWTRDGKMLATGGADKLVCLWETSSGKLLHKLTDHTGAVNVVAFSPDGKTLASAGADKDVRLWNLKGESEAVLSGHNGTIQELSWAPRGNLLASGGADNSVRVFSYTRGQLQREINAFQPVLALSFNPEGTLLACGTTDLLLRVYQISNGQVVGNLRHQGNPPSVTAVAWTPDGSMILAGRGNHTMQLWDPKSDKIVHTIQALAPVQYVGWTPTGSTMISGATDRTVRFWDTISAEPRGLALAEDDHVALISVDGHYRVDAGVETDLVYVVQTSSEQLTLKPADFATKYKWRNVPMQVKVAGK